MEKKNETLATKLAQIGREIGAVSKSGRNSMQNYNFIEYAEVAGRIRTLFAEKNVIIIPSVEEVLSSEAIANSRGGRGYHYILKMKFTIINGEDTKDREEYSWLGEATDFGDKGINKAETSGVKYFIMRLFNISEKGEADADAFSPEMTVAKTKPKARPATKKAYVDIAEFDDWLSQQDDKDILRRKYLELAMNKNLTKDQKDELKEKIFKRQEELGPEESAEEENE